MEIFQKNLLVGMMQEAVGGGTGYTIDRSLRFNSADSAYLSRTPASNGNRKTMTWSMWVKRSGLGSYQEIYAASNGSGTGDSILFRNVDSLSFATQGGVGGLYLVTSQVFRDVGSWYHLVLSIDTTQATSSNRAKVYVNGVQVTSFSTATYPSQNYDCPYFNTASAQLIGSGYAYLNGYLADVNFIDGQALTPADFGEYNATTGVWQPIAYAGTYGTNGFHLDFSDNSSTSALGTDSSGNSNNWTATNFSVTAGAGNDSLVDTPTPYGTDTGAGGEVGGNYATYNSLLNLTSLNMPLCSYSNGNLKLTLAGSGYYYSGSTSTGVMPSDKWYAEFLVEEVGGYISIGVINKESLFSVAGATYGFSTPSDGITYNSSGRVYQGTVQVATPDSYTTGDIVQIAFDHDSGKFWVGKNGTWYYSGDPAAGTNATTTVTTSGKSFVYCVQGYGVVPGVITANFGQRPFAYTAPTGFKALCTTNLPAPDVVQGDTAFNTVLYTGNGSTQSITGVGFSPDLVWYKSRSSGTWNHGLFDVLRGTSKQLFSNTNGAEGTYSGVTSFDTDGFTVGSDNGGNESSGSMVAWNWKEGAAYGLDIVSSTGNGSNMAIAHGLGVKPAVIISKNRTSAANWDIYHKSLGYNASLTFTTGTTRSGAFYQEPDASYFYATYDYAAGQSGHAMIHYCFAEIEGFSAFGKYTGNGSTDGPFIYTGFRPAFVMIKVTSTTNDWFILDNKRDPTNDGSSIRIYPNTTGAEYDNTGHDTDFVGNGFKIRASTGATNASGATYIYMAFAENPFKYSLAR